MIPIGSATYLGVDQRTSPRTDVYARVAVCLPCARMVMATIVNISADGVLLRYDAPLEVGGRCQLSLPVLGKTHAVVIWSMGGSSGLNFLEQVPERDYLPLLRALGARLDD